VDSKKLSDLDYEVRGSAFLALWRAIGNVQITPCFEKFGISKVDPNGFYPMQCLHELIRQVEASTGGVIDFVNIGIKQVEAAKLPDGVGQLTVIDRIKKLNDAFALNVHGESTDRFRVEVVSPNHVQVAISKDIPDDIFYGILYAYMRRVANHVTFTVQYDEHIKRQDFGGPETVMHIEWS